MTRQEFEEKSFDEVMEQLYEERDLVTTYDMLKEFAKNRIDNDDMLMANHIISSIWNDPNPIDTDWYLYDYSSGSLDTPTSVSCKEDVEHLVF